MNAMSERRLLIRTPEGVAFSHRLAGLPSRFLAWAVDLAVVLTLNMVVGMLSTLVTPFVLVTGSDVLSGVFIVAAFVIWTGYAIATEWLWRGQTLGKRVLRLRVIDVQGLSLHFSQIVVRNLLRFVDMLPMFYLLGGVVSVLNRHNQRLGDIAANTAVVLQPRLEMPDLEKLLPDKYNSFRDYPHIEARLRQRVSPEEASIAIQALMRRDELEPSARVELFRELAERFKAHAAFPEAATLAMSDENYVRNVVESLYRQERTRATAFAERNISKKRRDAAEHEEIRGPVS